jgi:predicted metalloprotease
MSRRSRRLFIVMLMASALGQAGPRMSAGVAAQVEDNTYTNPTFGWSVAWDPDEWTVNDERSIEEGDFLELVDPLSTVYFETYEGYDGNALDCVAAEPDDLAGLDAEDIDVGRDSRGNEIAGGDDESAYSVFTFTYAVEDGVEVELVEYNECRALDDSHVLELSQLTVREAYNDASAAAQALFAAVVMPGDNPVDGPESTTGGSGDDAGDEPEQLSFAEITDISEDVSDDLDDFWEEIFDDKDLSYIPPFYEVFDDEAESPCSNEADHAGIKGPFYCGLNQTIYVDLVLMQAVTEEYGTPAIYYAVAHEAGHDVQLQLGISWNGTHSIERELEADCMAGAFMRTYVDSGEMSEDEFQTMLELAHLIGDPPGVSAADAGAHGMGSQRVAMVLRGYYHGVDGCGTFEDDKADEG